MARTLMARLPRMTRTRSWIRMIPKMRLLLSNFCIYVSTLLFSFSFFSDRRSLNLKMKITQKMTAEVPYTKLESLELLVAPLPCITRTRTWIRMIQKMTLLYTPALKLWGVTWFTSVRGSFRSSVRTSLFRQIYLHNA